MKKIVGIILIVGALFFGYNGVNKLDQSGKTVEVLGMEISAKDKGGKETGYIYLGLATICLIGGIVMLREK